MKRWLILSTVMCLALSGAASASVQQGDTELDFLGGYMSQNSAGRPSSASSVQGVDFESLFAMAALGYFVNDNVQVGVAGLASWTKIEVEPSSGSSLDLDVDCFGIGVKGEYHFMPTNQWVPYVGGQLLWVNADVDTPTGSSINDADVDGVLWGPVAGVRYELNAYNDFFVEYQYHIWNGDIHDVLDDGHGIFLGLIHQFK